MSCPWASIQPVEGPISLLEVTSEQLATRLQEREIDKCYTDATNDTQQCIDEPKDNIISETDSDEVIAHLLQAQFNQEYDRMLRRTEEKFNRDAKVNVTYSNYKTCTPGSSNEPKNTIDEEKDFDRFVSLEKEYASIPRCGYKKTGEGSSVITKHDTLMTSRINACRVLHFPPGMHTGDTGGFDVKLNNKVFNSLRAHSHAQWSRDKAKARPKDK